MGVIITAINVHKQKREMNDQKNIFKNSQKKVNHSNKSVQSHDQSIRLVYVNNNCNVCH